MNLEKNKVCKSKCKTTINKIKLVKLTQTAALIFLPRAAGSGIRSDTNRLTH